MPIVMQLKGLRTHSGLSIWIFNEDAIKYMPVLNMLVTNKI